MRFYNKRELNSAMAALAKLGEDLVMTDDGPDHVAETVPLGVANGSKRSIESCNEISRQFPPKLL